MPTVSTIEHVVAALDDEVERSIRAGSRLGYFAALYREVTLRVAEGIRGGRFGDPARMERLDVVFALRYLDALAAHRRGEACSRSWRLAFDAAQTWPPLILQHLLVGMNAHIGLDLGVAAARTAPGSQLPGLKHDFDEITTLLGELVDEVQDRISEVSPWMWIVDRLGLRKDERLGAFGLDGSRRLAWRWAQHLAHEDEARQDEAIGRLDRVVETLGRRILRPSLHVRAALIPVRLKEAPDVARVVAALRGA